MEHKNNYQNTFIIFFVFLFAYLIRIIYPNLYMTGGDMPGHIMASLRLHLTSFLETKILLNNFFIQILKFDHGYTTISIPYLFYEIIFNFFRQPITEANLLYIHSFIGILSLISIFYFLKLTLGDRAAIISTIILSITPAHIGLSRAHIGVHIFQSMFFFLSLSFIYKYIFEKKNTYKV